MSQFAVVQAVYAFERWQAAAAILTDVLGLHPTEANQRARRSRGFLAENLDGPTAERIQQACQAQGLPTRLVAQAEVAALPTLTRIHQVWIAEDALRICRTPLSPQEPIAWAGIRMLAAYHVLKSETFQHWTTGGFRAGGGDPQLKVKQYSKDYVEHVADLFGPASDGGLMRLRLGSRGLNYQEALGVAGLSPSAPVPVPQTGDSPIFSAIGQAGIGGSFGPQKSGQSPIPDTQLDHFRLVLARIHARAVNAYVPPETLVLLGGPPPPDHRLNDLTSLEEFDAYNRWLLQGLGIRS